MRTRARATAHPALLAILVFGAVVALFPPSSATSLPALAPIPAPDPVAAPPGPAPRADGAPAVIVPGILSSVTGRAPMARTVALTFDDGPDPRWTPQVLDLLAAYGARATFCLVGENAALHEDLVRRIVESGMRLCNHSHTHPMGISEASEDTLVREIVDPQADLVRQSGSPVAYFRAPGGDWSETIIELATTHGMQPLGWTVDARDWRQPGAAEIVRRVQAQMSPGAVVLLHDGGGQRGQTVAALERLLPWLVENCYAFAFPTT